MNCFIKRAFMLIAIALFTFGFANAQEEKSTGEKIVSGTVSALKSVGKKTSKVKNSDLSIGNRINKLEMTRKSVFDHGF